MDDYVRRKDVQQLLCQSKSVSQVWDGLMKLDGYESHHKELLDTIQKQNEIIEKLSRKIEETSPERGYAMVNWNGEIVRCITLRMDQCFDSFVYRDEEGLISIDPVTGRKFEVFEFGKEPKA